MTYTSYSEQLNTQKFDLSVDALACVVLPDAERHIPGTPASEVIEILR